jgi:hypothetical protein
MHPYRMDSNWMDEPSQHVRCCCCYSSIEPTMFCVQNMTLEGAFTLGVKSF